MKHFKAIVAMSLNRVIGAGGKIPWHLPEDFKWFKKMTMGNVIVMGRKTFEGLGQPLPNRKKSDSHAAPTAAHQGASGDFRAIPRVGAAAVISNAPTQFHFSKLGEKQETEILVFNSLNKLDPDEFPNDIFICGGAEIYAQALPRCSDLYLTLVKREVEGDAFFRRLKINLNWPKKSTTRRSSKFCITGAGHWLPRRVEPVRNKVFEPSDLL